MKDAASPSPGSSSPTIVLSGPPELPRYPGLRFASRALRVLLIVELIVGGAFYVLPHASMSPLFGLLAVVGVGAGAVLLWAAAEFCQLGIDVAEYLRRLAGQSRDA